MNRTTHRRAATSRAGEVTGHPPAVTATGSRRRRIAFRITAWATALAAVAFGVFGLLEVVLMWLPDATLLSAVDDLSPADLVHRGHFNSIGIVAWALVPAVVVQVRRPERRVAPMLLAVGVAGAAALLYGLTATWTEWVVEDLVLLAPVLLLAALHPRAGDLLRRPGVDRTMLVLAALATVPWMVFAVRQAQRQLQVVPGEPGADMELWATSALMAVAVVLAAVIGATDRTGWRLPAWVAALASVDYGLHSLAFPDVASAAPTGWAVAAVAWGVAYGAALVGRSRTPARAASGAQMAAHPPDTPD